jgi:hypothetical protein
MGIQLVYAYSRQIVVEGQIEHKDDRAEFFICARDKNIPKLDAVAQRHCEGLEWGDVKALFDHLQAPANPHHPTHVQMKNAFPTEWTFLRTGTELPGSKRVPLKFQREPEAGGSVSIKITSVSTDGSDQPEISAKFKVQPLQSESILVKIGLIGMYASVVYAIGRVIKTEFSEQTYSVIYDDLDNPDDLVDIVNSISIAQQRSDLKVEYILYNALNKLLRSPENLSRLDKPLEVYGIGQVTKPPFPELLPEGLRDVMQSSRK